jgi:hypothetical protein
LADYIEKIISFGDLVDRRGGALRAGCILRHWNLL